MKIEIPKIHNFKRIIPHSSDFLDYHLQKEVDLTELPCWDKINEIVGKSPKNLFPDCKSSAGHWAFFFFFNQKTGINLPAFRRYRKHIQAIFGQLPKLTDDGRKTFERLKQAHSNSSFKSELRIKSMLGAINKEQISRITNESKIFQRVWKNKCPSLFSMCKKQFIKNGSESCFLILLKYTPPQTYVELHEMLFGYFAIRALYNIKPKDKYNKKMSPDDIKKAAKKAKQIASNLLDVDEEIIKKLNYAKQNKIAPFENHSRNRDSELEGNIRLFSGFRLEKYMLMTNRLLKDLAKLNS